MYDPIVAGYDQDENTPLNSATSQLKITLIFITLITKIKELRVIFSVSVKEELGRNPFLNGWI